MSTSKQQIGKNIKKYREEKNMSRDELAADLSLSSDAVKKWERGERTLDIFTLYDISRIFKITIDMLVGENVKDMNVSKDFKKVNLNEMQIKNEKADEPKVYVGLEDVIQGWNTYYDEMNQDIGISQEETGHKFAILRKKCFEAPNLEPNKLRELLILAKNGDTDAKNEIIMAHMKHVFTYLEKHYEFKNKFDYHECFSLAYVSLYSAINGYQFDKGVSFASYADNWIRKAVLNYFDSKKPKIANVQEVNHLIKAEEAYLKKYGLLPTKEQLSEMLEKTPEKIQKLLDKKIKRERK